MSRDEVPIYDLAVIGGGVNGAGIARDATGRGAKVLLLECSFLLPEDRDRATLYQHIHLDDVVSRADLFHNEAVVLTHFSARYRPAEIRDALRAIPEPLAGRVIPFLP